MEAMKVRFATGNDPEQAVQIAALIRKHEGAVVEPEPTVGVLPIAIPIIAGLLSAAAAANVLADILDLSECSVLMDLTGDDPFIEQDCKKYGAGKRITVRQRDGERVVEVESLSGLDLHDLLKGLFDLSMPGADG